MNSITKQVKEYVKKAFENPDANFKGAYENHFIYVVKYALQLAEKENADKEIVEIAAWLHDIGSIKGYYKNHHNVSAKIAEQLLEKLNYPKEKIGQVKYCILTHRGSVPMKKETKEAQILAAADVLAHFDDIDGLIKIYKTNKEVLAKLERGYNKLSDDAKLLVKDKLEKAREELK